jgi:hypothetical protein
MTLNQAHHQGTHADLRILLRPWVLCRTLVPTIPLLIPRHRGNACSFRVLKTFWRFDLPRVYWENFSDLY